MNEPLKILFKFPCRGRLSSFFRSLNSLNDNIRDRKNYFISLTLDEDDKILNNPAVIQKISQYPNTEIRWGLSESKIHAINRSMPDYDWDIVVCWSNDMEAVFFGFDDVIRGESWQKLQEMDYDMLLHYPEPDTQEVLNVLYIATKKYYDRFGYIYHPSYKSLWCDNESLCVAKMLGKYHFFGTQGLYVHKNPAYSHSVENRDELFDFQQSLWAVDEANFHERRKINFELKPHEIVNQLVSDTFPYTS